MQTHLVKFVVTYAYGTWHLTFHKLIELPCVPFTGLEIEDETANSEGEPMLLELRSHDYQKVTITYNTLFRQFEVLIRHLWRHPVTDEHVDSVLRQHVKTGWKRTDGTNESELKALMRGDSERKK